VKLLLDTHAVIWRFGVDEGLSEAAVKAQHGFRHLDVTYPHAHSQAA